MPAPNSVPAPNMPVPKVKPAYVRLVSIGLLVGMVLFGIFLIITSSIVRYVDDIKAHPRRFVGELLLVSLGFAVPYVLIALLRRSSTRRLPLDTLLLTAKLIVAWVLFELSGFNTFLFPTA